MEGSKEWEKTGQSSARWRLNMWLAILEGVGLEPAPGGGGVLYGTGGVDIAGS